MKMKKERVTITMDEDILRSCDSYAEMRRLDRSTWMNNALGQLIGLVHPSEWRIEPLPKLPEKKK